MAGRLSQKPVCLMYIGFAVAARGIRWTGRKLREVSLFFGSKCSRYIYLAWPLLAFAISRDINA